MNNSPITQAADLRIGTVDFVSPDEIKVLLDIEAPEAVALNAGGVRPFPRINGYVLVLVDDGYLVGQIEWLTVERSAFPKRRGVQDFGLIDLPYPLRKMSINPLGTLRRGKESFEFRRGADALPSVGAAVHLPTDAQLRAVVESGARRRVQIGTSPLAGNAEVQVDPDRLFGRHLAVLGNTGSGKSCSVAGLVRWSLDAARQGRGTKGSPNARFIVLDPNGEYARAFKGCNDSVQSRVFSVGTGESASDLNVPLWFWNSSEWSAFTQASTRAQRPLLRRALREVKAGRSSLQSSSEEELRLDLRRYLSSTLVSIRNDVACGAIRDDATKFGFRLRAVTEDIERRNAANPLSELTAVTSTISGLLQTTLKSFSKNGTLVEYFQAFTEEQVDSVVERVEAALLLFGGVLYKDGPDEDVPLPYDGVALADHLQLLALQENVSQYVDFLVARMRTFLSDSRIQGIVGNGKNLSLTDWLDSYLGGPGAPPVTILDLSLVPSEVVHTVTAVASRMIFEALQRYRKLNGKALPTTLIVEEAHTFVRRYKEDAENQDAASVCCQVFERIAREGRKFGLGLVLSSQRPSELSPTVLSQCNTFLLHRISNDRDQELVRRLVPDNLRGLLRELPSLPSQHAILLGWASELPVMVRMRELPEAQRPHSSDPDFWDVWTGMDESGDPVERDVDWKRVADDWQGNTGTVADHEEAPESELF